MNNEELKEGYIRDYISGVEVKATPEEVEAVQVFSKILVEDYGYPKENIQTRPQFRVKASPSDLQYKYPIDITVFSNSDKKREDTYIVVECKKKNRKDGMEQLKHYLEFSNATIGVWFNGTEKQIIRKYYKDDNLYFDENLTNIPKYNERIEDIGNFKRKDLKKTHNLKHVFATIRGYLAGNAVGTTRDEEFAKQLINMILCKLYDEKYTKPEDMVCFRAGIHESAKEVSERIKERFEEAKKAYPDVLESNDKIELDDKSILYIVGELQPFCLLNAERDVVGDAFEVFIHGALKGGQGQFFTPKNVVKTAINILDPDVDDKIIDPACGSGGFLIEALKYVHNKIDQQGVDFGWTENEIFGVKSRTINQNIRGIERDKFLSKVAKAYMVIMGDGKSGIYCEDSLEMPSNWGEKTQANISLGEFDIVLTNPPFGAKIPVKGEKKLSQYDLGYKWKIVNNRWEKDKIKDQEAPQILFIDRCLQLLKEGGKMAIVLPDGMLSNPTDGYIVQYLLDKTELIGIIDLPMSTFLPYTPTKTHLAFFRKTSKPRKDYTFFMSYAKTCGHDKRGKEVNVDEISMIPDYLETYLNSDMHSHLGFQLKLSQVKDNILMPKYYNPDINNELDNYVSTGNYVLKTIGELEEDGIIELSRGNEIGSEAYGTGDIPFIRTSEISNWEITTDCTHCVSREVYEKYRKIQKLEPEDILVVNDGTYLMGRTAMLSFLDTEIIIQSHIRRIKVLKKDKISPYLLLALLGLEIVQRQIEAKSFRQGTISTLGSRLKEVILPIPTDSKIVDSITKKVEEAIKERTSARKKVQTMEINNKVENLMGIKNKSTLSNL